MDNFSWLSVMTLRRSNVTNELIADDHLSGENLAGVYIEDLPSCNQKIRR